MLQDLLTDSQIPMERNPSSSKNKTLQWIPHPQSPSSPLSPPSKAPTLTLESPWVYGLECTSPLSPTRCGRLDPASSRSDTSNDGPPQRELLTRTPVMSRTSILYNFSKDFVLREQYRDPWNEVRIGKLLEDLDALAGAIAVKHCFDNDSTTRSLLVVTACVDKMVLKKPIRVDTDLKITGAVTWVGRSMIDIQIEVTQIDEDDSATINHVALTANFTFVARDSKTGKSASVNRLSPETGQEKLLFEEGEARDRIRKKMREEQKRGFENGEHNFHGKAKKLKVLLAEGRVFCDMPALANRDSILIRDTCLENSLICQPQNRNFHEGIFGGFLMNRAFELALSTAYAFLGQMPRFLEVDHVDFLKPNGWRIRNVVPATEEEARRVLERIDAEKTLY